MDLTVTSDLFEVIFGLLFFVAVMVAFGIGHD
jgi:hypothetical protein